MSINYTTPGDMPWIELGSHGYNALVLYQLLLASPYFTHAVTTECECGNRSLSPIGSGKGHKTALGDQVRAEYKRLLIKAGWDGKTGCPTSTFTKTFKGSI